MLTKRLNNLITLHKELCRELGIHPARIRFDDDIKARGNYCSHNQAIRINMRVSDNPRQTMAHETYHHYQCVKGWLTPTHWKGRDKGLLKYLLEHDKRPWEIGAIRYANKQRKIRGWNDSSKRSAETETDTNRFYD